MGEAQMAKPRELLILKYKDFRSDVSRFYVELNEDPALRSLFFENPTMVLRTRLPSLGRADLDGQHDELANKLLFSALSNERFVTFMKEYQEKKNEALSRYLESPDDERAASEFDEHKLRGEVAEALLAFGDKELLSRIIGRSGPTSLPSGSQGWFIVVVFIAIALAVAMTGVVGPISGDLQLADSKLPIPASELRKIADQLVVAARQAREAGEL
jgi:hypothetical protein